MTEGTRKVWITAQGLSAMVVIWVLSGLTGWTVPDALWAAIPTVCGLGIAGNAIEHWAQRPVPATAPTAEAEPGSGED